MVSSQVSRPSTMIDGRSSSASPNSVSRAWNGTGNAVFGTVYNDNSLTYTAPKLGNTTVSVQHVFGSVNGSSSANSQDAVTAVYSDGGLRLSALYYNGKGNGAVGTGANATAYGFTNTANTNRLTSIGALYTTGPWTMSAALFDGKIPSGAQVPATPTMAAGSTHTTATALALSYKLSPEFTLSGGHYILKDKTNSGNKANQTAISLDYNMFKDTVVYAQAASTSRHRPAKPLMRREVITWQLPRSWDSPPAQPVSLPRSAGTPRARPGRARP